MATSQFGSSALAQRFTQTLQQNSKAAHTQQDALSGNTVQAIADAFSSGFGGVASARRATAGKRRVAVSASASLRAAAAESGAATTVSGGERDARSNKREIAERLNLVSGFAGDNVADVDAAMRSMTVSVAASSSASGRLPSRSIGAPAVTSMFADSAVGTQKSDIESAFQLFFGEPRFPYKSDFDIGNRETWTLPLAYQGQAVPRISETIEQYTLLDGSWHNSVVAPIQLTNEIAIRWSKTIFNPALAETVPHL